MLDKTFEAAVVEPRIAAAWDEAGAFAAGRGALPGAAPYTIVIPPPNVTGSLHMGHALNNTLQDILVRLMRMRGRDVLWQPGTDHAGIATQMVVERQLAAKQEHRRALGREEFLKRVWAWKAESGGTIVNQLKRLGASCDWSRERFTMDEGLSKAVLKVFVGLYREGLIYKDKRLVNWDPKLLTAISDLEVVQTEVKGSLWHFRYPLAEGYDSEDPATWVVVATTRPETMLGDTAVAVNPEDDRYRHLIGKMVRLPLVGRLIPIVADDYSDPEKGTGAVKITPAHDFNDFEVGKRHNLPQINIFDVEAHVTLKDNADFLAGLPAGRELDETLATLHGQERFAARKAIVARMEALGLLEKIEPHTHMVPHGDRGGVPIEPYLTDQWYVNAAELAKPAIASVREGRTTFVPKNWEKTYYDWMENIQPWCISRQLWWGHQIPAWYGPDGKVFVAESEAEARAEAAAHYGAEIALTRDEDVLDTWFSSALWPFSTLGWPDDTAELKRYYPTNVLVTGFDIIFFWVARMMMMGLHFMGTEPFSDVYIHALVRDEKGAKMSKSKGNVIDPLELIDEYGADALRFTLAAMAAQGRDIKLATSRVAGYRNFATKLWNAVRFAEMNGCGRATGFDPDAVTETLNRWVVNEARRAAADVTEALDAYRFDAAAGAAYRFVWNGFCDWYLELTKPILTGEDGPAKDETRATCAFVIDEILKLLHPFMPFITEELWARTAETGPGRDELLVLTRWSEGARVHSDAADEINWLVGVVSEIRSVRAEMGVAPATQLPLVLVGASAKVTGWLATHTAAIQRLARVSAVSVADVAPPQSAQIVTGDGTIALPLAGVVDLDAETARLSKEADKLAGEIARIDKKLSNEQFVAKAPEEVVEEERAKREGYAERLAKVREALARLG
ncbi:valine--tRNA ligase [Oharaeibacter diazotrophicus]|uniref:Valine--tRNA ligase n=1 Tax=Oharaeibacter diazotrophicus TaxID=1920512 RepID=A0A4R6RKA5_9HYPH|nr:valine--tRNA ligase [Oharaeibacter diazotrophicus]TDP86920.1 valyl-tRNA synthetase [Oharaeibacter diazotrophicus]BBE71137.1 valine-tRNA ligase [Pleomorphomonas sp. SM30]GLS77891.1 valine--tRNA ligase [Oharaeibacter diazotrophicus]